MDSELIKDLIETAILTRIDIINSQPWDSGTKSARINEVIDTAKEILNQLREASQ